MHSTDIEIVTKESVDRVKEKMDADAFEQVQKIEEGVHIRVTNSTFMTYATKGRFRFNKSEYYFMFHELLVSNNSECKCTEMRRKLGIGAKAFFYYVKKLCMLKLIEKTDSDTIRLIDAQEECKKSIEHVTAPKCVLKNVSVYIQIADMIVTREEGVCTSDVKEQMGMSNKQALICLKKIASESNGKIVEVKEFEGKLRRNRYITKVQHEIQKQAYVKKVQNREGSTEEENKCIDTETRRRVIEEIVEQNKVVLYSREFHTQLASVLRTRHEVDKNTVVRAAKNSHKIDIVRVFVQYENKTVTRNVLKMKEIEDTDSRVIDVVMQAGYKTFTILTKDGAK